MRLKHVDAATTTVTTSTRAIATGTRTLCLAAAPRPRQRHNAHDLRNDAAGAPDLDEVADAQPQRARERDIVQRRATHGGGAVEADRREAGDRRDLARAPDLQLDAQQRGGGARRGKLGDVARTVGVRVGDKAAKISDKTLSFFKHL